MFAILSKHFGGADLCGILVFNLILNSEPKSIRQLTCPEIQFVTQLDFMMKITFVDHVLFPNLKKLVKVHVQVHS